MEDGYGVKCAITGGISDSFRNRSIAERYAYDMNHGWREELVRAAPAALMACRAALFAITHDSNGKEIAPSNESLASTLKYALRNMPNP